VARAGEGMDAWWSALPLATQVFCIIAAAGTVALLILLAMSLIGFQAGEIGHADPGVGGDATAVHVLGVRTVTAFLVGFGWTGLVASTHGAAAWIAVALAFTGGCVLMLLVWRLLRALMGLTASGSLDYANAIGATASVYLAIPAEQAGAGQVEVLVQGRLAVVQAMTRGAALESGRRVRVVALNDPTTLVVEAIG
jgi:hypothetical protein